MHRDIHIEEDTGADANQSGDPSPSELEGFVPLGLPLAAVIAKLRGRTLVKVKRVTVREENNNHPP